MPKTSNNNKEKSDTINGVKEDSIAIAKKGLKSLGFARPIVWFQVQWSNVIFDRTTENEMNLERRKLELKYNVVIPKAFYRKVKEKERAAKTQVAVTTIPTGLFSNATEPAVVPDSDDAFMDTLVDKAISEKDAEAFLKNLKEFNKSGVYPEPEKEIETTWFGRHGRLSLDSDRSLMTVRNAFFVILLAVVTMGSMLRGKKPYQRRHNKTARNRVQRIELLARKIKDLKSSIVTDSETLPQSAVQSRQRDMDSAVESLQEILELKLNYIDNAGTIQDIESALNGVIKQCESENCTEVNSCLAEFIKQVDSRLVVRYRAEIDKKLVQTVQNSSCILKNLVSGEECDVDKINVQLEEIKNLFFTNTLINTLWKHGAKDYVLLQNNMLTKIREFKKKYLTDLGEARQQLTNYKNLDNEIIIHNNSFDSREYDKKSIAENTGFLATLRAKILRIATGKINIDPAALKEIVSRRDFLLGRIDDFTSKNLEKCSCSSPTSDITDSPTSDARESHKESKGYSLFSAFEKQITLNSKNLREHAISEGGQGAANSKSQKPKTMISLYTDTATESDSESTNSDDQQQTNPTNQTNQTNQTK